ncbi:MAG: peptidylprolyl isomerase [Pseudomonadota bacterium]
MGFVRRHARFFSAACAAGGLAIGLMLSGCGLGRGPETANNDETITNPVIAATVNGRPIYVEDVRSYAVQRGLMQEGQDLDANSDAFYFALEELIQFRLFAMEAESRGLDREPDVHRRLENARERVLAAAIYDEIDQKANDPAEIERLYRENSGHLGQGQEVHLRHIQFDSKEAADAAKRRLDHGERFEALAFELSTDRATAADGGDMGFVALNDLAQPIRDLEEHTNVGQIGGPVQVDNTWHLIQVDDRRDVGAPSLEELRPRIIQWLRFKEISELQERLERNARIERRRARPDAGGGEAEPAAGANTAATTTSTATTGSAGPGASSPPPDAEAAHPGDHLAPAFPFPMGPGGIYGQPEPSTATTTTAPTPTATTAPAAPTGHAATAPAQSGATHPTPHTTVLPAGGAHQ